MRRSAMCRDAQHVRGCIRMFFGFAQNSIYTFPVVGFEKTTTKNCEAQIHKNSSWHGGCSRKHEERLQGECCSFLDLFDESKARVALDLLTSCSSWL